MPSDTPAGQCYMVGGAVRDQLLGREVKDRDYVVVGATPEAMLQAGFKPVGENFPVFLHPTTREEYALARTERKSGRGYKGFVFYSAPDVSLKDDLRRRDLTINAMALDAEGKLIDHYGGENDLREKRLRHVSPAFAEDPLRVLRVARFAATLPDFTIADDTLALMRQLVEAGELRELPPERVWRELARGIVAAKPSRMITALDDCGALQALLPEIKALQGVPERLDYHPEGESYIHTLMVIDAAAHRSSGSGGGGGDAVAECFAALLHDTGKAQTPPDILPSHYGHEQRSARLAQAVCERLKTPRDVTQLAVIAAGEHGNVHKSLEMRPAKVAELLMRLDALRRPQRFELILRVCEADFYYLPERANEQYAQGAFMRQALAAAQSVDQGAIVKALRDPTPDKIAAAIHRARANAIRAIRPMK